MSEEESAPPVDPDRDPRRDALGSLWPSPEYDEYIRRLKQAIGRPVYLAEIDIGETQTSARLSDRPLELLAVAPFPRPDPRKRLYPHMILLEDGRGINLGRIARISTTTPFDPPPQDVLFVEAQLKERELFAEQRFSRERMARTSRILLGGILAKRHEVLPLIEEAAREERLSAPMAMDGDRSQE